MILSGKDFPESNISEPIKELRRVLLNADVNFKVAKKVLIKIVHGELVELGKPATILISGISGSGQTTFSVKLASYLSRKERQNPLLVSVDISRPAAIEQLKICCPQIRGNSLEGSNNPIEIVKKSFAIVKCNDVLLIIDHAVRIDEAMMNEIKYLYQEICPSETLFVVDAMTGQDAVNTAKAFLTKLDGALTIRSVVPIKFISTGENMSLFYPERMAV